MNSTKLFNNRNPDGTYEIVSVSMPTSENMEKFLKYLKERNDKNLVPLSSNETADYAVSSHKEIGELKKELKNFKEAFNGVKKIVMEQDQNNPQRDQETDTNTGHSDDFEQPSKKTKLEEQNEEIQKLNQIIQDLKKDAQKQTQVIKNLKEDNIKLYTEVTNLKYGEQ